jgi:hypothetical protein
MGYQHLVGLDLGQTSDFTAVTILEWSQVPDPEAPDSRVPGRKVSHYAVRHLERLPPGTPFTEVCARLRDVFAAPLLMNSMLVVDLTGVGQPVLELIKRLRLRARIRPMMLTAGHQAHMDERGTWLVPKQELVSTLQVLLQARRLQVAQDLSEAETLVQELLNFQMKKPPLANEPLAAWREGPQDDLVLAVAIAAWEGERHPPTRPSRPMVLSPGWSFHPPQSFQTPFRSNP